MTNQPSSVSQNQSFSTVFLIEMWERFGYYGMQVLIVYYMVQRLGFDDTKANLIWSATAALIYVSPAIGGWVGDKLLGTRRSMVIGAIVLALGYLMMALPGESVLFLYISLSVIVVGNGLFKPNAGNLVRKIYEGDDAKIDSAFTLYYMAVNIGSMAAMLLTPWVKDYVNQAWHNNLGWHAAFAICVLGLLVGLGNYMVMRKTLTFIGSDPDFKPIDVRKFVGVLAGAILLVLLSTYIIKDILIARVCVYLAGIALLLIFIQLIRQSDAIERPGLVAALILTVQTMFFFIFYQQMSTSLSLFALRNVNPSFDLLGIHLWNWKPAQFQAINPICIFLISPLLAWIYGKKPDINIATKFAMGFAAVAVGFFIYSWAGHFAVNGKTNSWVMVFGYLLGALGELLVSGLGLAMISRYIPARMGGFMMGAYFVATGVSQYLGGVVANFASVPQNITDPVQTMPIYTSLFAKLGWAGVICMLIALAVLPLMSNLAKQHRQHKASKTPLPTVASEQ